MDYDKRIGLPQGHTLKIENSNTGNTFLVLIKNEVGRGGSCIVYNGLQLDNVGSEMVDRKVIIKEYYPKDIDDIIKRSKDMDLVIPEDCQEFFNNRLGHFYRGQKEHIDFANDNSEESLHPLAFSGEMHNTFYAVSYANEGCTLASKNREDITLIEALKIVVSVSDVISRLHSRKKMYLDCKPENIWCYGDRAYIFDFDTVQTRGTDITFCSYSDGWAAPEQLLCRKNFKENRSLLGYHTDIFSIGAVLFYMLVGRKPSDDDIKNIQSGYCWENEVSLTDETNALRDPYFIDELNHIMTLMLQPNVNVRKARFGELEVALGVKKDFEHLVSLAENTAFRIGFAKLDEKVEATKESIDKTMKKMEEMIAKAVEDARLQHQSPAESLDHVLGAQKKNRKISLNEPCPCGSGKKYKLCCGEEAASRNRRVFTMENRTKDPTFNSIINNPQFGDEREFVHICEVWPNKGEFQKEIEITPGKQYMVRIYFHNNANSQLNYSQYNHRGIALGTRLFTHYPNILSGLGKKQSIYELKAVITADNTTPPSVSDSVKLTTKESFVSLRYVLGSAKIHNEWNTNDSILSTDIFNEAGALIGLVKLDGAIPGGIQYSGMITYVLEARTD